MTAEESFQDFQLHKFMKKDFEGKRCELGRHVLLFLIGNSSHLGVIPTVRN